MERRLLGSWAKSITLIINLSKPPPPSVYPSNFLSKRHFESSESTVCSPHLIRPLLILSSPPSLSLPALLFQARFQAAQIAEKEEKLIHLLESRQDETIRRINHHGGYGDAGGGGGNHSANSLSSSNSANSVNPGRAQVISASGKKSIKENPDKSKIFQKLKKARNPVALSRLGEEIFHFLVRIGKKTNLIGSS